MRFSLNDRGHLLRVRCRCRRHRRCSLYFCWYYSSSPPAHFSLWRKSLHCLHAECPWAFGLLVPLHCTCTGRGCSALLLRHHMTVAKSQPNEADQGPSSNKSINWPQPIRCSTSQSSQPIESKSTKPIGINRTDSSKSTTVPNGPINQSTNRSIGKSTDRLKEITQSTNQQADHPIENNCAVNQPDNHQPTSHIRGRITRQQMASDFQPQRHRTKRCCCRTTIKTLRFAKQVDHREESRFNA